MATTTATHTDPRYRSTAGEGYDGVVRVSLAGYYATGVLLYDGRAVLTAAHLGAAQSGAASVRFETSQGVQTVYSSERLVHPLYSGDQGNHDLMLLWLPTTAPVAADRYALYRSADEVGQAFDLLGYGRLGTGQTGATTDNTQTLRIHARNTFDTQASTLKTTLGAAMGWTPVVDSQLVADFDDGSARHDALAQLLAQPHTGLGLDEGLIAPGDSGGPALIAGQLAGIASYTASLTRADRTPDIDTVANSSFGEIAAWQRVSYYQQWLDQSLRARYPDAPSQPSAVQKSLPEGHNGSHYAYFLLQFTGQRSQADQVLQVDYATRDGSATAGSDYLAAQGQLRLYPGETQAAIAVEVLGDTRPEASEYFYLDVFNPVGGSFGAGRVQLTAMRTIVDDDTWGI